MVGVGGAALKERDRRKRKAEQQKRRRDAGLDNLFGNSKALDEAINTTVFSAADHCPDELIDEDLMNILTELTRNVMRAGGGSPQAWMTAHERAVNSTFAIHHEIRRAESFDLTTLSVALRQLRNLTSSTTTR